MCAHSANARLLLLSYDKFKLKAETDGCETRAFAKARSIAKDSNYLICMHACVRVRVCALMKDVGFEVCIYVVCIRASHPTAPLFPKMT